MLIRESDAMSKTMMTVAVLVSGLGLFTQAPSPAEAAGLPRIDAAGASGVTLARGRHYGGYGGARHTYRPYFYARPVPRVYAYAGPVYGYSRSNCGWLHHKAHVTGSRYWWNRYRHEC